jgi:hypothetical protein
MLVHADTPDRQRNFHAPVVHPFLSLHPYGVASERSIEDSPIERFWESVEVWELHSVE